MDMNDHNSTFNRKILRGGVWAILEQPEKPRRMTPTPAKRLKAMTSGFTDVSRNS